MTYEDSKIKDKSEEYSYDNDIQALDAVLKAQMDYEIHSAYDGMLEVVNEHLSKAYEQGYKDALKEMEEKNDTKH